VCAKRPREAEKRTRRRCTIGLVVVTVVRVLLARVIALRKCDFLQHIAL
jgi:hypothetical protein